MKTRAIAGILLLGLFLTTVTACNPFGGDNEELNQRLTEVTRGDLAVTVSGTGNIEIDEEAKVTFRIGGRIEKIFVNDGEKVAKGDLLAKIDTTDLELALTQSQVALTQAETALAQAEVAVTQAELAINSANVSLRTARHNLEEARDIYTWPEINVARDEAEDAEAFLQYVLDKGLPTETILYAQLRFDAAESKLDTMIRTYDTEEVAIERMEVAVAEQTLTLRQQSLGQAQKSREYSRQSVELARQSLEYAQKQIDDATITAPINGVVADVYVKEGDVIPPPTFTATPIIHLIDPTTMELNVEVDEIDMPGVELNQKALIEVDALSDLLLEGKVTLISSLAKEEGGVVLYDVTISFDVPQDSQLKAGMSADAAIIITERKNVVLLPSRAINKDSEGNTVVEVIVDEESREKPVVTGLSDDFDTEIVSGLSEGEVVILERQTK